MPWNECKPMDERLRFIARLLEGEKMAPVCRELGISRAPRVWEAGNLENLETSSW
jgi:hypothetical protein